MKFIIEWEGKVCEADRFANMNNKNIMISLIRKFITNDDGKKPKRKELMKLKTYVLKNIWNVNAPNNLFNNFFKG